MRKVNKLVILSVILLIALVTSVVACSGSTTTVTTTVNGSGATATATKTVTSTVTATAPATTGQVYKIKLQSNAAAGSDMEKYFNMYLVDVLEKASGGRLDITHTASGSIVPDSEILTATSQGVVDMAYAVSLTWANTMPIGSIQYGYPGQYRNKWDILELQMSGMMDLYRKAYADQGVYFVGQFLENPLDLNTKKPINTLADLKGLKIRAGGAYSKMLADIAGVSVVTMAGSEIYTAMTTNVIDGFVFADINTVKIFGFTELVKSVIDPPLYGANGGGCVFVNNAKWNALPADLQALINSVVNNFGKEWTMYFWPRYETKAEFMAKGITFTTLPASDLKLIDQWAQKELDAIAAKDAKYAKPAVDIIKKFMANR